MQGSVIDSFIKSGFLKDSAAALGGRSLLQLANYYVSTKSYTGGSTYNYFG